MHQLKQSANRSGLLLSLGVAAAVALTAWIFAVTKQQRETSKQRVLTEQISSLLPSDQYDNNPALDSVTLDQKATNGLTINSAYLYKFESTINGAVLHVTTSQGYSGNIELLVALNKNNLVHGVAIVAHTETPGLGDKIEPHRSGWLTQFTRLRAAHLPSSYWAVKKEGGQFDQITGATITPRAVVNAVSDTIDWYSDNRQTLL